MMMKKKRKSKEKDFYGKSQTHRSLNNYGSNK